MKIILDDVDINYINCVKEEMKNGKERPLIVGNQPGNNYYLNFTVTDVVKANNFILTLLDSSPEYRKELEEVAGICVNSFNFCSGDTKINRLKDILQSFINQLDMI